jgi:predicted DCC family thiol-disulfide oxidoreductase YuxK
LKKARHVVLTKKVIFYDESCPMCQLYTEGFVRLGVLPREGRVPFGQASVTCPEAFATLDLDRARIAIPLVDIETGEVVYGLDSLFLLIGHKLPWLRPVLRLRFLKLVLTPLYRLISYNRRRIAGCRPPETNFDCRPKSHPGWRAAWIGIALLGWLLGAMRVAASPLLLGIIALQIIGLLLTVRRGWDAIGSLATNYLSFGILLRLFESLPPILTVALATAIALIDLRRRAWIFAIK